MEFLATLETGLISAVAIIKFCLESISIACVVIGLIKTLQLAWQSHRHRRSLPPFSFNQIRIRFGTWLSLALEFQLGGDIVATTVTPTIEALAKLALIAIIRTFLNYFLSQELETELSMEKERSQLAAQDNLRDF
ncbi:conserved hypothetical protein [Microcystis aeruginosa PCC 9432]|jgi:uncharacterized membrane protein|uniref:DUF1622 domain-containing protein n=5 Tax=Microcystis TaxID=1125 RepID=S3KGC7_MICAE|nr:MULTISPECIES: DUF1622 domain-containing protein [Microcystis]MDJ0560570.1 DUF1622 domain-containing protein [Microcystis sp. M53599_WE4]NCR98792.1 DUF1622 domain-containing protein [Microcystis aeruginosa L311-01]OCY14121.1 MAG: hypothetical protein BEV12_20680 [Microcystis aeruginosa CACIAM 03]REJ56626.1 MAG: DUF1622 domain-containing protein [Microcystis aeruginosa DA14]TRT97099.1 MAG: DUF1622 domain-containing protein [Microcystis aeruginosa Ma_OC_LR_19540900_S633]TRU09602.1 MAG: DUF162